MNKLREGSDKNAYRDANGLTLADYPRPSVAVDTALLTLLPSEAGTPTLAVLQVKRPNDQGWSLPGTFLHEGERLRDAVRRSLRGKAGVTGLRPRQLQVFDEPDRDDRGWVLSVAHVDVGPVERLHSRLPDETRLVPVEKPGRLPYGHVAIIREAVRDLRARYQVAPDPDRLLETTFTLRDLRLVHEGVAGHALQRDTFRRTVDHGLVATGTSSAGLRGRPAELFARS